MGEKLLFAASTAAHIRKFHLPYLRRLKAEGWEIHAACSGSGEGIPHTDRVIEIPFRKRMFSVDNLRAAWLLRREIRVACYAAIIVHTSLAAFFTRLAVLGLKDRPKVVNMVHGYLFDDRTPLLKRSLLLAAEKLTAPATDLLITMNRYDFEIAKKHRLGIRIEPAPGVGVDFSALEAGRTGCGDELRRRLGIRPEDFVLIYPAEFSDRKMQHILLHAMAALPEHAVLVLPGTGDRLNACRELAKKLGISHRVRFPGYVADMPAWYEMANAAVSASRSEGLPFNVMEAMYFSLPVVASRVKGHVDLILDGKTGLLYPCGDWEACAGQIRRLMEDPALARSLAQAGAENVKQYGLRAVEPKVMGLYRSAGDTPPKQDKK
jgi:glycosyltransferase EpsD